jgi:hypothetical protein
VSDSFWSVVIILSLAGWVTSTLFFIFRVFPSKDHFEARQALVWGGCTIVFYALWVVGLVNA